MSRRFLESLSVMLLAAVAAQVPDGQLPAPGDRGQNAETSAAEFEETPAPRLDLESSVTVGTEPAQPMDPKVSDVLAELDRMERQAPLGASGQAGGAEPSMLRSALRALSGLCIVVALILVCAFLLKKYGRRTSLFSGVGLGAVLGKIHLSPQAALYFVRTGDRVLVLGVTTNSIALVSEFDAASFGVESAGEGAGAEPAPYLPAHAQGEKAQEGGRFRAELEASARALRAETPAPAQKPTAPKAPPDADIDSLRKDILRLQRYLKENLREE